MRKIDPLFLGQNLHQVLFDTDGVLVFGKPQAATKSADMGVDHDSCRQSVSSTEDYISSFTSHACQVY